MHLAMTRQKHLFEFLKCLLHSKIIQFFFIIFRFRERETHSVHLKNIEAELDAQMAKVEQQALAKAKREYENERLV